MTEDGSVSLLLHLVTALRVLDTLREERPSGMADYGL